MSESECRDFAAEAQKAVTSDAGGGAEVDREIEDRERAALRDAALDMAKHAVRLNQEYTPNLVLDTDPFDSVSGDPIHSKPSNSTVMASTVQLHEAKMVRKAEEERRRSRLASEVVMDPSSSSAMDGGEGGGLGMGMGHGLSVSAGADIEAGMNLDGIGGLDAADDILKGRRPPSGSSGLSPPQLSSTDSGISSDEPNGTPALTVDAAATVTTTATATAGEGNWTKTSAGPGFTT